MAFIVGATIISAGASVIGGAMQARGAKKAANIAAQGSEREIQFARESRDLAREDQKPYREAGHTALDALMSMTGLGGGGGGAPKRNGPMRRGAGDGPRRAVSPNAGMRGSSYSYNPDFNVMAHNIRQPLTDYPIWARNEGGPTQPNTVYNVSELAPENVYRDGRMQRHANPVTIDGATGYVEPNIEGRFAGGAMGNRRGTDLHFGGFNGDMSAPPRVATSGTMVPPPPQAPQAPQPVQENPGGVEGGYNFMTDPGYNFRFDEGQRALERGAAARGGLLSGGFARKAIRYGQDYASNEYGNVYNRISNIAGLGQVSAGQSGQYAMYGGQQMGTAAAQGAAARASGYQAAGNAWANAGNQIAQMPWDKIFPGDE